MGKKGGSAPRPAPSPGPRAPSKGRQIGGSGR